MHTSEKSTYQYLTIHDLAAEDRPRERLAMHGASALSNAELISILLGSGARHMTSIDLAKHLLKTQDHCLAQLAKRSIQELIRHRGIGHAKASTLVSAMELSKRLQSYQASAKPMVASAQKAYQLIKPHLAHKLVEECWVLLLNRQNKLIKMEQISKGGLAKTTIDPKVVFKTALDHHAHGIIVAHNHPSGRREPSKADIEITTNLLKGSRYLHIDMLDHLIITSDGYFSFQDHGLI